MEGFFDCKFYSTARSTSLELTFYGSAENTIAASMAFELAHNLIADWASSYKAIGRRNSYCLGASDELRRMAQKEKAAEEVEAKRAETDAIPAEVKEENAGDRRSWAVWHLFPGSPDEPSCRKSTRIGADIINNDRAASQSIVSSIESSDWKQENSDQDDGNDVDTDEEAYEGCENGIEPRVRNHSTKSIYGSISITLHSIWPAANLCPFHMTPSTYGNRGMEWIVY